MSKSTQGKRKPKEATDDCVDKLSAKIKRLEKANEGLMKRIIELEKK